VVCPLRRVHRMAFGSGDEVVPSELNMCGSDSSNNCGTYQANENARVLLHGPATIKFVYLDVQNGQRINIGQGAA
jgi:hypothetical protein